MEDELYFDDPRFDDAHDEHFEPEDHHDADREGWNEEDEAEYNRDLMLERQEMEDFEQADEYFGFYGDDF